MQSRSSGKKINQADAVDAGVEEHVAQFEQVSQEQDKIDTNLEILRMNLRELESKVHTEAVDSQLAQVKAGIATQEANKSALRERMAQVIQTRRSKTNKTSRLILHS